MKRFVLPVATILVVTALVIGFSGRLAAVPLIETTAPSPVIQSLYILLWLSAAWLLKRISDQLIVSIGSFTEEAPKLLMDIIGLGLFAIAIFCIISFVFKQPVSGLLATSGLVVAILGLALQSTFANIFSGMALNIARPFRIGDWLELNAEDTGRVTQFNWREARLETLEGKTIVIPNGQLAAQTFTNLNTPRRDFRVQEAIFIDYSAPPERVMSILEAAIQSTEGIVRSQPSVVLIEGCFERGVKYTLNYWVPDYPESIGIRNRLLPTALNYLNQAGLAPSYPKHDVRLQDAPTRHIQRNIDISSLLRRVPLFECLNDTAMQRLEQSARLIDVDSQAMVVQEAEDGESLFIVVTGLLEATRKTSRNTLQTLGQLSPGEVLGEMSLLTGAARNATVTTLTPTTLLEISKSDLEPILRDYPELISELSEVQAQRLEALNALESATTTDSASDKAQRRRTLRDSISRFFQLG